MYEVISFLEKPQGNYKNQWFVSEIRKFVWTRGRTLLLLDQSQDSDLTQQVQFYEMFYDLILCG